MFIVTLENHRRALSLNWSRDSITPKTISRRLESCCHQQQLLPPHNLHQSEIDLTNAPPKTSFRPRERPTTDCNDASDDVLRARLPPPDRYLVRIWQTRQGIRLRLTPSACPETAVTPEQPLLPWAMMGGTGSISLRRTQYQPITPLCSSTSPRT